ncbi:DUF3800 domain-containing protein [Bradyrhizobium sp. dw_411]|uniref:DUF3800 domain-containing protein n=1 Tax=Bradyrhizobium sp. dw_411 TaxID=2720082 RepID=UPI001BCB5E82|nr:DUF3800 domain-containing protein [Bradyrhizobium sp. dw_411]
MMLQAFIDDSGNDGRSPVFVLAGFIASADQWKVFSDEWDNILNPKIGFRMGVLKMADVYRNRVRGSRYKGLSDAERDARLKALIQLVNRHAMHGVVSVVPYELYNCIIKGNFNLQSTNSLDRPYFLSFFGVMTRLFQITEKLNLGDKIEFIFDTQDNESKAILMSEYDRFISLAPDNIAALSGGYPSFKKDEESLPLQAADMLAWHIRKHYSDQDSGKDPTKEPSNIYLANLFKPEHDVFDLWDKDRLTQVRDALSKTTWQKSVGLGRGVTMTLPDPTSIFRP